MLAVKAGAHWELSEDEATQLSKAVANVARHYPVAASQKAADWSQLLLVVAVLGVPRAVQSRAVAARPDAPRPAQTATPAAAAPPAPVLGGPVPAGILTPSQMDPGAMAGSHLTGRA